MNADINEMAEVYAEVRRHGGAISPDTVAVLTKAHHIHRRMSRGDVDSATELADAILAPPTFRVSLRDDLTEDNAELRRRLLAMQGEMIGVNYRWAVSHRKLARIARMAKHIYRIANHEQE